MAEGRDGDRNEDIGNRIRIRREAKGWSQARLADKAGLNRNVVNTAERGLHATRPENLLAIAKALDLQANAFDMPLDETQEANIAAGAVLSIAEDPARPGFSLLRVERVVSTETALEIYRLISRDRKAA